MSLYFLTLIKKDRGLASLAALINKLNKCLTEEQEWHCFIYFVIHRFSKIKIMYKSIQNKKYYFAINKFPKTAKKTQMKSNAYKTGLRFWNSDDMKTYAVIVGTFRIMFGVKKCNTEIVNLKWLVTRLCSS